MSRKITFSALAALAAALLAWASADGPATVPAASPSAGGAPPEVDTAIFAFG